MQILPDFDLKHCNTFAVAAQASYFITCDTPEEVIRLSQDEFFRSQPYLIIGGGSNLLFVENFVGCVVRFTDDTWEVIAEDSDSVTIKVSAGKKWHDLVMETAKLGYWGIENLALIPGDCGAAAVQNIGAYGVEICQTLQTVHTVNLKDGSLRSFSNAECKYDYRYSVFKEREMGHYLIYAIELKMSKVATPQLSYAGLQELSGRPNLSPSTIADHVISIRESKLPDHTVLPNAGSFFMNPIVDSAVYGELIKGYGEVPHYRVGEDYKISAAWLIEKCGYKGKKVGNVGCYEKQPLVIVNYGDATGEEIASLSSEIQKSVKECFGIDLHPEVRFIKTLNSNPALGK